MNDNKKAILNENEFDEDFDFDELERQLEAGLEDSISELEFLEEDKEKIGNPENLGNAVMDVVWDQFVIQIGAVAGEDFVKENRGLRLDLREEAHVQSVDNFEQQKYATHNAYVDYEKRGEEYRSNFYTDPNEKPKAKQMQEQRYNEKTKVWETYDNVDEEWKKTLRGDYRKPYEEDRRKNKNKLGNKTVHKDHQVADATIARDAEAGTYMILDEKVKVANAEENLNDLDSAANQSKSDHDGEKWAKHKRTGKNGEGQTNAEYFGIDEDEYIEKDRASKEAYEEKKRKKKEEEIALGKKSQREEAFRIGGKELRAAVMGLLKELIRNIISKLIAWLKSKDKNLKSFLAQVKEAISAFLRDIKRNLLTVGTTIGSTVLNAIFGPVVSAIQKVWTIIKQGGKSVKEAIDYVKNPANRNKSFGILMLEVGKIVMTGLTATGALVLGEVIEKALLAFPVFAFEIPLLGSLANIIGIFLGAVVAGIAGALVLNLIDKMIANKKRREITNKQIEKGNEILAKQTEAQVVSEEKLRKTKKKTEKNIKERHEAASKIIKESTDYIFSGEKKDNSQTLADINSKLDQL
jgi:hypothetical protein